MTEIVRQQIKLLIEIDANATTCGDCEFLEKFHTGIVGEWHMKCAIFKGTYGKWREDDMKRAKACLKCEVPPLKLLPLKEG